MATLSVPPLWGILLGFQTPNFFELGNFVPTLSISPVLGEIFLEDTLSNIQLFLTWEFCANPLCSSSVGNFAGISNTQFLRTWEFCANPLHFSCVGRNFVSGGHIIKWNFSPPKGRAFHFLKGPPIIFIVSLKPTQHFPAIPAAYPITLANSTLIILRNVEIFNFYFFQIKKYGEG